MAENTSQEMKSAISFNTVASEIENRLGIVPNFFRLNKATPDVAASLWGFAKSGYLDNPLPLKFKERLYIYFSQFCEVRYCLALHVAFLVQLGSEKTTEKWSPEAVEGAVRLIRQPLPKGKDLDAALDLVASNPVKGRNWPSADSELELALFACASHIFLQTSQAAVCVEVLRRSLDLLNCENLLLFLAFVRTSHFWTRVHPHIEFEDDIVELLAAHEALATCVLLDPEVVNSDTTQVLRSELTQLRKDRDIAELLRVTLASIGDGVIATDLEGKVTALNQVAENVLGWHTDEAAGISIEGIFKVFDDAKNELIENPAVRALREGCIITQANCSLLRDSDGNKHPIEVSAAPIRDRDTTIAGSVLVFRDVTERRVSERRTQEALEYAESLINTVREPFLVLDSEFKVASANRSFYRTFKVTPGETTGHSLFELGDGHWGIPQLKLLMENTLPQNEAIENFEVEHDFPHLGQRTMILNARRVLRSDDNSQLILLAVEDITDRKQSQRRLRELASVVESSNDAIITTNLDGIVQSWNSAAERILGYQLVEVVGQPISILVPEERLNEERQIIEQLRAEEHIEHFDTIHVRRDGTKIDVSLSLSPLKDASGNVVGESMIVRDISDRKRAEDALRRIAAELSEANRHKTEFLATLGHELRNPLAPIRTGLEAMKLMNDAPSAWMEIRDTMERQTQQLARLIDDLLDISRVTQGKMVLRTCRVVLSDVVRSAVEATKPFIDEASHELTLEMPSSPIYLNADPNRIAQVISNLLNNSTKYTPVGGHITLKINRDQDDAVISVKDNGLGIPSEMLGSIFEMFTQISRPVEKGYTGLGIGLTLVKRLVELHRGTIDVHSAGANQGSEFIVRLPVMEDEQIAVEVPSLPTSAPMSLRILVVDDNKAAAKLLKMLVGMLGHDVRIAHDGQEAIQIASEFLPEFVLMDLGMPVMNGYEAARYIRSQHWGQQMRLVALTGWGQEKDRVHTTEAGFDYHLVKPAEPAAIQAMLSSYQPRTTN